MAKNRNADNDSPFSEGSPNQDNFGLPDFDFKPLTLDNDTPGASSGYADSFKNQKNVLSDFDDFPSIDPSAQRTSSDYQDERPPEEPTEPMATSNELQKKSPLQALWWILLVVLIAAGGYAGYRFLYKPWVERREAAKQEQLKIEEAEALAKRQAEEARQREAELESQRDKVKNEKQPVQQEEGSIERISAPMDKWHIVVASSVDDDLIMDRAKKLKNKGLQLVVVDPYGRVKFTRLSISRFDDVSSAQEALTSARQEYGSDVWILKY